MIDIYNIIWYYIIWLIWYMIWYIIWLIWYDWYYIWYDWYDIIWYDWYDMIWYDMIFIWYMVRYMIYNMIMIWLFNCNWVDTRLQQYSRHLHTTNTQITQNGTYKTITKLSIHNNKKLTNLGGAGRAPSLQVIPWHLPYS
jgi:hypothetical protein